MSKMRVYELAKILGKTNKELMKILEDLGVEVKTHMSSIDNDVAQLVEDALSGDGAKKEATADGGRWVDARETDDSAAARWQK